MKMFLTNKDIFEIYISLACPSSSADRNIKSKIIKYLKYILIGYLFKRKLVKENLNKLNKFQETEKEYPNLKLVIYTVISGKYDIINRPIYIDDNIDYYVFTDHEIPKNSPWKRITFKDINISNYSPLEQARYVKTHPHIFFPQYDYSMFIDGNIQTTCDVKPLFYSLHENNKTIAIHKHQCRDCIYDEAKIIFAHGRAKFFDILKQMRYYKKGGFPKHYGLFETNILIRKHNDIKCKKIMEDWWKEINTFTKRDQLSFTYVLWKNGLQKDYILSLGNNSRKNPYFIVKSHNK